MVKSILHQLCSLSGVSGSENEIREYILNEIRGFCDAKVDSLGNILVFKKGKEPAHRKVLFAAHMDEVGLIVTKINEEGYLKFDTVGGIDARILLGKRVKVGKSKITGVIGACPIHLLNKEEREKASKISSLTIDIGALNKEDALKIVKEGDIATFDSDFVEFGEDFIKCKAIDDRLGCLFLMDLIKSELKFDTYFAFTAQEEVGLRGAFTAAYELKPDIVVVAEATTAADFGDITGADTVCKINEGAVISFMDSQTFYDKKLYSFAGKLAKETGIKWQTKTKIAGGNDAGAFQRSLAGIRVLAISVPCRYLHSPSCVISAKDCEETEKLIRILCEKLGGEENV
jgi:putative aminopeptidase FrvX